VAINSVLISLMLCVMVAEQDMRIFIDLIWFVQQMRLANFQLWLNPLVNSFSWLSGTVSK
jgi:hypothetical protein